VTFTTKALGLPLPFYAYFMLDVCLNFQISFVIDERLRGKGYKRKVTPFPLSHTKASPDLLILLSVYICSSWLFVVISLAMLFVIICTLKGRWNNDKSSLVFESLTWKKTDGKFLIQDVLRKLKSFLSGDEALGYAQYVSLIIVVIFLGITPDNLVSFPY